MMNVLAINSGSPSLKFKVVEFDESSKAGVRFTMSSRYAGFVEEIGPAAKLMLRLDGKTVVQSTSIVSNHAEAVQHMMQMLEKSSRLEGRDFRVDAVGHRVVHGGEQFREPVVIDDGVAVMTSWIFGIGNGMQHNNTLPEIHFPTWRLT